MIYIQVLFWFGVDYIQEFDFSTAMWYNAFEGMNQCGGNGIGQTLFDSENGGNFVEFFMYFSWWFGL